MCVAIVLKTDKSDLVIESESYLVNDKSISLVKPRGNILRSMSFLKNNIFDLEVHNVIFKEARLIKLLPGECQTGKLEQSELLFEYQGKETRKEKTKC